MEPRHHQDPPIEDLRTQLQAEQGTVSSTETLLAAVKAGPPPERAWLVEEMARRDRQTAEALRSALQERTAAPWLRGVLDERDGSAETAGA